MDRYLDRLNEERAGGCSEDEARRREKKAYAVMAEDHRKLLDSATAAVLPTGTISGETAGR